MLLFDETNTRTGTISKKNRASDVYRVNMPRESKKHRSGQKKLKRQTSISSDDGKMKRMDTRDILF